MSAAAVANNTQRGPTRVHEDTSGGATPFGPTVSTTATPDGETQSFRGGGSMRAGYSRGGGGGNYHHHSPPHHTAQYNSNSRDNADVRGTGGSTMRSSVGDHSGHRGRRSNTDRGSRRGGYSGGRYRSTDAEQQQQQRTSGQDNDYYDHHQEHSQLRQSYHHSSGGDDNSFRRRHSPGRHVGGRCSNYPNSEQQNYVGNRNLDNNNVDRSSGTGGAYTHQIQQTAAERMDVVEKWEAEKIKQKKAAEMAAKRQQGTSLLQAVLQRGRNRKAGEGTTVGTTRRDPTVGAAVAGANSMGAVGGAATHGPHDGVARDSSSPGMAAMSQTIALTTTAAYNMKPRTKVVIRLLPPKLTAKQFRESVDDIHWDKCDWFLYYTGKLYSSPFQNAVHSRAYMNFATPADAQHFCNYFNNRTFVDQRGRTYKVVSAMAPFQKLPRNRGMQSITEPTSKVGDKSPATDSAPVDATSVPPVLTTNSVDTEVSGGQQQNTTLKVDASSAAVDSTVCPSRDTAAGVVDDDSPKASDTEHPPAEPPTVQFAIHTHPLFTAFKERYERKLALEGAARSARRSALYGKVAEDSSPSAENQFKPNDEFDAAPKDGITPLVVAVYNRHILDACNGRSSRRLRAFNSSKDRRPPRGGGKRNLHTGVMR
eukprot:Lankesteria_metandrocarpae@DN363_c0_g1_i1.p1